MKKKKDLNIILGGRVRDVREAAGLTQERFAEIVSFAPKNVSDIERGVVGISIEALIRICERLSISSDDILFGNRDKNRVEKIAERLANLPPEQFALAEEIINKLFEILALSK